MSDYVADSFKYGDEEEKFEEFRPTPFLFDSTSASAESSFEVYFTLPGDKAERTYNYGFCIDKEGVTEEWLKLVVFVPLTHMESVKDVLGDAGAGQIGNYSHCSFFTQGEGSFLPLDGANPTIGVLGKTEVVSEARLEVVLAASSLKLVLEKLKEVHPYEEVAYDLYPLKNKIPSPIGMGRVGVLKNKIKLGDFAKVVKEKLNLPGLRFCGDIEQEIQKVALCGGAGMSLVQYAKNAKVDVFLTGDIKHHEAEEAMLNGVALIDGGHFGTEKVILPILVNYLEQVGKIEVYQSQSEKEIFKFK